MPSCGLTYGYTHTNTIKEQSRVRAITEHSGELAGSALVMHQTVTRWHCGVLPHLCRLCCMGAVLLSAMHCSQGTSAADANPLSFLPRSQRMYSNAHKETGPETAQITQRSSCLRACEARAAGKLLQLKGAPAEKQTGRRMTHACILRR